MRIHASPNAPHDAVDFVGSVPMAGCRGHGHEVSQLQGASIGYELRPDNVGVVQVPLTMFQYRSGGTYFKAAATFCIKNRGKNAGGVEPWEATPIDGAVGADQRGGIHITN